MFYGFPFKKFNVKAYRTINLSVVLDGCESQSLTLREELTLRVFENRVVSRMFVSKRKDITGQVRKLHSKELSDLFILPNIIRVIKPRKRIGRFMYTIGERRDVNRVLVGNSNGKGPLGRCRHLREGNIVLKIRQEVEGVAWTGL